MEKVYTMKQMLQKYKLNNWRYLLRQPLTKTQVEMAQDWNTCAIGERIRYEGKIVNEKNLMPEARLLGYDFYLAVCRNEKDRATEILDIIENLPTVWKKSCH